MRLPILFILLSFIYSAGCGQALDPDVSQTFGCIFEISPSFPGGYSALFKFIRKNLKYPKEDWAGVVYVRFVVNEDGTLSDLKVVKGLCEVCDKNALEVFRKMPKWIPGKVNNIPVKIPMIYPIRFKL